MNWCDHIKIEEKKHTRYRCGGKEGLSECVFNFCPECGAKRPEPKGLAEKFLTAIAEHRAFGMGGCTIEDECQRQKLAQAAIDHACEVINSMPIVNPVIVDQIKQALRESI